MVGGFCNMGDLMASLGRYDAVLEMGGRPYLKFRDGVEVFVDIDSRRDVVSEHDVGVIARGIVGHMGSGSEDEVASSLLRSSNREGKTMRTVASVFVVSFFALGLLALFGSDVMTGLVVGSVLEGNFGVGLGVFVAVAVLGIFAVRKFFRE